MGYADMIRSFPKSDVTDDTVVMEIPPVLLQHSREIRFYMRSKAGLGEGALRMSVGISDVMPDGDRVTSRIRE